MPPHSPVPCPVRDASDSANVRGWSSWKSNLIRRVQTKEGKEPQGITSSELLAWFEHRMLPEVNRQLEPRREQLTRELAGHLGVDESEIEHPFLTSFDNDTRHLPVRIMLLSRAVGYPDVRADDTEAQRYVGLYQQTQMPWTPPVTTRSEMEELPSHPYRQVRPAPFEGDAVLGPLLLTVRRYPRHPTARAWIVTPRLSFLIAA
jgi:hypothetical protein